LNNAFYQCQTFFLRLALTLKDVDQKDLVSKDKVFKMKDYDKSENHDSPVTELAAPLMFIAGLFALVALVSSLG